MTTTERLIPAVVEQADAIAAVRRDLHAHPELGFNEFRTADIVATKLQEWGIPVHRGMAKTGVVGILKNGSSSRAIGLRADMDALPMHELNTFAHASTVPGRMHGCGHDGHTAMLLAAAQYLARHRNYDGTVYLIFQPAEEGGGGGREMIKDGLFSQFPMDAVFGMHNWPELPVGQFGISPGPVLAATARFKITIRGKGGHAALPHKALDPVPVGAAMLQAIQTIVTRSKNPVDDCVVSLTMFHAGEAPNVIPDLCELQGSARAFSPDVLTLVEQRMRQIAEGLGIAHGVTCEVEFTRGYPPTVNAVQEAAFAREVMVSLVGEHNVLAQEPTLGAEDFGFMLQAKPGAYFFIGNGDDEHRAEGHGVGPCVLHNPSYDFNDAIIPLGATCWVHLAEKWLSSPGAQTVP